MIFKDFANRKLAEKMTDIIFKIEDLDYAGLKHLMLQIKWDALKDKNDKEYDRAEAIYDCLERLETFSMKYKEV